ncbi:MAG: glycogen synthase GlgA [Burkholderiaceae bacterium]
MLALKVLFAASEVAPWVKTGGLGDVAAALPAALAREGCDVRVLVPGYPAMLRAFPRRERVAALDAPPGVLPRATLSRAELAPGLSLLLLEAPGFGERDGNPYLGPDGRDWPDNAARFALLSHVAALLASDRSPLDWRPDVVHCNDWQSALAPAYTRHAFGGRGAACVVTIHNLTFMGLFGPEVLGTIGLPPESLTPDGVEFHGRVSFLKAGLALADRITTVSPTYAREIQTPDFGCGLEGLLRYRADRLAGILNGIDTEVWDPASDPALEQPYDAHRLFAKAACKRALQAQLGLAGDAAAPLLGVVSRLTEQKGLDLLLEIGDALVGEGAQLAVLGSGEHWMEHGFRELAGRHPGRCATVIGFDEALAHRVEAGADVFVMPSRFEPCGLNQMYSLRYGTVPVVRRTGGLADTVVDASGEALADGRANGFVFDDANAQSLLWALRRAIALRTDGARWESVVRAGMAADFGWEGAARRYLEQYRRAIEARAG